MKRHTMSILFALVFAAAGVAEAQAAAQPRVATDQADYHPGSTVSISGAGFQPGETIRLQILQIKPSDNEGQEHQPWQTRAGDRGGFQARWPVTSHEAGATLRLTATGVASGLSAQTVFTDASVNPASGGSAIPADTYLGSYTPLTGPAITETIVGDISVGTIVLTAPPGFVFDTNPPLPIITLSGDNNNKNINYLTNGAVIPLSVTTNTLSLTVTAKSKGQTRNTLTYSDIRVRPTAASPLASGNITNTGTSIFPNSTANYGTLIEVAGAATQLVVSGFPSPQIAGVPGSVTVAIQDQLGNPVPTFAGTVHFTSSDPLAILPADYTFVSADNGSHTFSGGVTLNTLGTQSITVSNLAAPSLAGTQPGIVVNAAPADHLAFATQPGSATYGSPLSPQPVVVSQDAFGNVSTAGLGASHIVTLALTGGTGQLVGTVSLDLGTAAGNGVATFAGLTVSAAGGGKQLTASAAGLSNAVSSTFTVAPAPLVVAANNATRPYGQPNPVFTASFIGFVNGENTSALGGALVLTTTAQTASPPGNYPIVPSGLLSTNYTLAFSNGVLTVTTTNQPPLLAAPGDAVIRPEETLMFPVTGSDPNGDRLTFSLDAGAPEGAMITNVVVNLPQPVTNTVFFWRPSRAQASTTNVMTLRVTDDGGPPLSATQTFTVVVLDYLEIAVGSTNALCGRNAAVPIYLASSDGVTNVEFSIRWSPQYLSGAALIAAAPGVGSASLQDQGTNLVLAVQAAPGQVLQGTQLVAQLSFVALSNQYSAFVPLPVNNASAAKPDGAPYTNYIAPGAMVSLIAGDPLLWAFLAPDSSRNLMLFGQLGASYQLQYSTNLGLANGWALWWSYVQTNSPITLPVDSTHPVIFYRIVRP